MLTLKENICPSCKTPGLSTFYEAKNVPVNSCLMFSSEKEATNLSRGKVILGFCSNCGFISNTAFDPSKITMQRLPPKSKALQELLMYMHSN